MNTNDTCSELSQRLRNGELPANYRHIFICVGDNGPDQIGTRNSLRTLVASDRYEWALCFTLHCLKHSYHLAAQANLRMCDNILRRIGRTFKYYTSVATLSHTWRGHLAKMRSVWFKQHEHDQDLLFTTCNTPHTPTGDFWSMGKCGWILDCFRVMKLVLCRVENIPNESFPIRYHHMRNIDTPDEEHVFTQNVHLTPVVTTDSI